MINDVSRVSLRIKVAGDGYATSNDYHLCNSLVSLYRPSGVGAWRLWCCGFAARFIAQNLLKFEVSRQIVSNHPKEKKNYFSMFHLAYFYLRWLRDYLYTYKCSLVRFFIELSSIRIEKPQTSDLNFPLHDHQNYFEKDDLKQKPIVSRRRKKLYSLPKTYSNCVSFLEGDN